MSKATFLTHKETAQADNQFGQFMDILNGVPGRNLLDSTIQKVTSLPSEETVSKQVQDLFKQECGAWSRAKKHL